MGSRVGGSLNVSVDGTDCTVIEPTPFSSEWFSHKCKGPSSRYEIGFSISTAHIVWVNDLFLCGSYPDLKLFREGMKAALAPNEKVVADGGYPVEKCLIQTLVQETDRDISAVSRSS